MTSKNRIVPIGPKTFVGDGADSEIYSNWLSI